MQVNSIEMAIDGIGHLKTKTTGAILDVEVAGRKWNIQILRDGGPWDGAFDNLNAKPVTSRDIVTLVPLIWQLTWSHQQAGTIGTSKAEDGTYVITLNYSAECGMTPEDVVAEFKEDLEGP